MEHYSNDSTPITLRQLESLVRLAQVWTVIWVEYPYFAVLYYFFWKQARAKAELREVVTVNDARDVIELVKTSFDDVFKTDEGIT